MRESKYAPLIPGMVRNLRVLYARSTAEDKTYGRQWYPAAFRLCSEWSTDYDTPLATVAGVVAAVSVQCEWSRNLVIAQDILADRPISIGGAIQSCIIKARHILADRAEVVEDDGKRYFKSAPKVRSFHRNLQGLHDAVTVDTHAVQAALGDVEATIGLKDKTYQVFASAYLRAAVECHTAPDTFQAIIWHTWKRLYPIDTKRELRRKYAHKGV